MKSRSLSCVFALLVTLGCIDLARGSVVGRPVELDITIMQGGNLVVQAVDVVIPGLDPLDGKNYIEIGDINGVSSIYLSVWMQDPTAEESLVSFYVRSGDPSTALVAGVEPLFDLGGSGDINVSIDNLEFEVGGLDSDVNVAQFGAPIGDNMSSMYMMNSAGWYYDLPETEYVLANGKHTQQVPYSDFRDPNTGVYNFVNGSGTSVDIAWQNMLSPVDSTYTIISSDTMASAADTSGGAVFEMGLSAFAWGNNIVPEPGTVALMMLGGLACLRRRRS